MSLKFWQRWLVVCSAIVLVIGALLVVAPEVTIWLFGLLLFGDTQAIARMGVPSQTYVRLVHAVLGAAMIGWALMLVLVSAGPFARRDRGAWTMLAASLSAWFVPDTTVSLLYGFWPNALSNVVLAVLFAIPLTATRSAFTSRA